MALSLLAKGLLTAGSWAATRALPSVMRGITGLLGKKLSLGGALLVTAAPTALSYVDRVSGHALSEALVEMPFGDALEHVLAVHEFSNDQKASVVSNLINKQLIDRQIINENDQDFERSQKIIDAMGHAIIGDIVGAATIASNTGMELSDIMEAINVANAKNPDGSIAEISVEAFSNIKEQLRKNDISTTEQKQDQEIAPDIKPEAEIFASIAFKKAAEISRINDLNGEGLVSEFNAVVKEDNLNMFSSPDMFMETIFDFLGFGSMSNHFKRAVIMESAISDFRQAADDILTPKVELEKAAEEPRLAAQNNVSKLALGTLG
jgi:uncharacterized protein YjaG (DUF416 family)